MRAGAVIQFFFALGGIAATPKPNTRDRLRECPGYRAVKDGQISDGFWRFLEIHDDRARFIDLELAGKPCNVYGKDLPFLKVTHVVETPTRLHVQIADPKQEAYQVPELVFPRPKFSRKRQSKKPLLEFEYTEYPFSFRIVRTKDTTILFDSSAAGLVFEDQYIRLRTSLPVNPNLYGFGEHSDSFRLKTNNYTRTLWNADTPSVPAGWNLYGSHPMYIEHRQKGTHGVFLLNSNGMDVVIDSDPYSAYLEYNILGGVLDFYFFAGETPIDVAKQYSEVVQQPALVPYGALGLHQCRWGYQDVFNVAEVVHNYSQAGIPLETMWTDIDYMDGRAAFSLDPERFPLEKMRQLVQHLHSRNQKFVMMLDPAIAVKDYGPYNHGKTWPMSFLVNSSGLPYEGVVWPGRTVYPDWFAPAIQEYWNKEFDTFFNPATGVDIDYLWIDMNEPSNFCDFPCNNIDEVALQYPPPPPLVRSPPRELPGWPCDFQPPGTKCDDNGIKPLPSRKKPRTVYLYFPEPMLSIPPLYFPLMEEVKPGYRPFFLGFDNRDLINPPYTINNAWGVLPQKSLNTSIRHSNGLTLFDTHNLYGHMMAAASRRALIAMRSHKRPFIVTRSTFAGSGAHAAHWLGDNDSSWEHYRLSIRQMLQFNSMFQVSMVGSDVCGFNGDTTEELCARWAMLGAFQPFYRNHNAEGQIDQEFYRWPSVTQAAKKAIDIRYRLLDYFYTALMIQSSDGTPAINPMFYIYPKDANTWGLDMQYFFGPSLMVAPVQEQGSTSVKIYFPNDVFYDFHTHEQFFGIGQYATRTNQTITDIPLFVRGGQIIPMRARSTMTTTELRQQDFELLIAVGSNGRAKGVLYLDDGETLQKPPHSYIEFNYKGGRVTSKIRSMDFKTGAKITKITIMGGKRCGPGKSSCSKDLHHPLKKRLSVKI
ncbi:alpha-glucosidase [Metarhizium anisopliae]